MRLNVKHRLLLGSLVGGLTLILVSANVEANDQLSNPEGWIDQLTTFVMAQKASERVGNFDPYLARIRAMRTVLKEEWPKGDLHGTYAAMAHLMGMLENREGGIRVEVAEAIADYCYQVAPVALHYGAPSRSAGF